MRIFKALISQITRLGGLIFLYWIDRDLPSDYLIENSVFKSLTCTDSMFNYRMENRKRKEYQEEEQRKRIEEREKQERAAIRDIENYCKEKGLFFYKEYEKVIILKALTNNVRS